MKRVLDGALPLLRTARPSLIGLATLAALVGCSAGPNDPTVDSLEQAITCAKADAAGHCGSVAAELPSSVVIPLPTGYERYCSVMDMTTGAWDVATGGSDPCTALLNKNNKYVVMRAGLIARTAPDNMNNVMVLCYANAGLGTPTVVDTVFAPGIQGIQQLKQAHASQKFCLELGSPDALPIFTHPWAPQSGQTDANVGVTLTGVHNFDVFGRIWFYGPVAPGAVLNATTTVDHFGNTGNAPLTFGSYGVFEPAYDWSMESGRPLRAVAPGVIRGARMRDLRNFPDCRNNALNPGHCSPRGSQTQQQADFQGEIYLESQVDTGWYSEHFVTIYHHMDNVNKPGTSTPWPDGGSSPATVIRGQTLSAIGNSGASGGPHLDFQVLKLTNLSGARGFSLQVLPVDVTTPAGGTNSEGHNGTWGCIDPFGWQNKAGTGTDVFARFMLGSGFADSQEPSYLDEFGHVADPGAYSIKLWTSDNPPVAYADPHP